MTDDDIPGVNVSPSSMLSLLEGGSGTFSVTLNTYPTGDVTVALTKSGTGSDSVTLSTNSLTFTQVNYEIPQIVTVTAKQDDDALVNNVTLTLDPSGADYGSVANATVTVNVTDDDSYGYVLTPNPLTIEEGMGGRFTVAMTAAPRAETTVTLASSSTDVTIADTDSVTTGNQKTLKFTSTNWNTPQTVTLNAAEDSNDVSETATITLSATITGVTNTVTDTLDVTVNDNDEPNLQLSTTALTASEGGSTTFTVQLTVAPTAAVTLTVAQPAAPNNNDDVTISPGTVSFTTTEKTGACESGDTNWNCPQTVTVSAGDDDDALNDSANIVLTGGSTSGNYNGVTRSIALSVTDNDTPDMTVTVTGGTLTMNEGGSGTFSVKLDTQPGGNVAVALSQTGTFNSEVLYNPSALIFTPTSWGTAQTVTVNSLHDDDSADDSATISLRAAGGEYDDVTDSVSVSVTDDDTAALRLSDTRLSVDEGGSETFTVELTSQPSANVTVTPSHSAGSTDVTVPSTALTFTTQNWNRPQSITVSAASDNDAADDTATINLAASGGGYNVSGTVQVTVDDDEEAGLEISLPSLTVSEGATGTFTVRLTSQPSENVTVTLTHTGSGDITFSPTGSLTFTTTNWNTMQTITVTSAEDDDTVQDNKVITLTAGTTGGYDGQRGSVSVSAPDNDGAQFKLSESALRPLEGSSATFTVALASQPSGNVTVTLGKTGSGDVGLDETSLTFTTTNWSTAQTVTVSAAEDDDAVVDSASIALTASGGGYGSATGSLSVSVIENDAVGLELSESALTLDEGGSATFTVKLASEPSANVSVSLGGTTGTDLTLNPTTALTFTTGNWSTAQTVTVSAGEDSDTARDNAVISLSAGGGDYGSATGTLSVAVIDNDAPGLTFSSRALTIAEGANTTFTVRLNTQPSAAVTLTVARLAGGSSDVTFDTDSAPDVQITPIDFTTAEKTGACAPADKHWNCPRTVTVSGGADDDAVDDRATLRLTASGGNYARLSGDVSVTVTDDETVDLTVSTSALTVTEGGTAGSFTVKLNSQPSAGVTVNLSVGNSGDVTVNPASLSFTTGNWDTNQSVSVSATDDDDHANGSATIRLNAVGGDYTGQTDSVSVTVTDDDTAGLSLSQTSLSIAEGGSKLLTVALKSRPSAAVTVSLAQTGTSNPEVRFAPTSLSFAPDAWSALQTVVVSGRQDSDADDESATIRLSAGSGYGSVSSDVSVTVVDDDTPGLTLSPSSLTLNEGTAGSFTVVLDSTPSDTVTVSVGKSGSATLTLGSNSLTFSSSNWNTPKTVTVTAGEDDNAVRDTGTISLSASGGGYVGVTGEVSVSVPDNDTPELRLSESALSVTEGKSGTFKVRLSARPSATVTVTPTPSGSGDVTVTPASLSFAATGTSWSTEQTVTVTAGQDDDSTNDSASISLKAADGGYGSVSKSLSVTVIDVDTPALTVSASELDLVEGGTAGSFTVKLATQPSGAVTVTPTVSGSGDVTVTPASRSFTTSTWDTVQTFTVNVADDNDAVDERAEISLAAAGAADYAGVSDSVSVTVDDSDTVGMTLSATSSLAATEGASTSFTVKLDTQPSAPVTVNLAVTGSSDVTLNASALIFTTTNWSGAQTVTVSAAEDDDAIDDSARVNLTATGGDYGGVTGRLTVGVTDNDSRGLDVSASSLTVGEGASGDFTVALETQPSANVTVSLTQQGVSNSDIDIAPASLVFTPSNWSTAREVTVSAAEDPDAIADSATIQLRASGGGYGITETVSVSVTEADTVGLDISKSSLTVEEGAGGDFTVKLDTQPSTAVTVNLTRNGSSDVVLGSTSLSFTTTNWNVAQSVRLTVSDDDDAIDEDATIALSASNGDYAGQSGSVRVSVEDDDEANLNISVSKLSVTEGGSGSFTVVLDTRPSTSVTVNLTSTGSSDISFSPASLGFTTSNWAGPRTVTVNAGEDDDTEVDSKTINIRAVGGDYEGKTGTVEVTANDNDTPGLTLSASSLEITEGASKTFTVVLTQQPSAAVTVTLTRVSGGSSDVTLGASSLSFTTGNWNMAQSVTVSAAEDDDALADSASISVSAAGGGYDGLGGSVSVEVTENDTAALTLSESSLSLSEGGSGTFTVALKTQPSGGVTVNLTTSGDNDVTLNKPSLVFTASNWGTAQSVTVSAGQDNDAVNDSASISLSASGGSYGGVIGSLSVSVTDDDTGNVGLDISRSSLKFNEGASATFTVALNIQPSAAVRVTLRQSGTANTDVSVGPTALNFTASNWGAPQTVTVSAIRDADATDDSAALSLSATGGGYDSSTGSVTVTVTDLDTGNVGLDISKASLAVDEGGSDSFTVKLKTQPSDDVNVTLAQPGTANSDVMLDESSLDFTSSDWNVPQTVRVTAAEDADAIEDRATINLSATGGDYADKTGSVSVTVTENDRTALIVSKDSLTVEEGMSGTFTVALKTQPSGTVSVSVKQPAGSDNSDVTLSDSSLSFTTDTADPVSGCTAGWNCPQTVTVSAGEDPDALGEGATINLAAMGGGYNGLTDSVTVTVTDNDAPGLTLSQNMLKLNEGGSGSFKVKLDTRPSSDVTVNLSRSGSTDVTLDSAQLRFTTSNWGTDQEVTVNAAPDADAQDDEATISLSAAGGGYDGQAGSVSVEVTDSSAVGLVLSDQSLKFDEGESGSFTVRLNTQPSTTVRVTPSQTGTTNSDVELSPASLSFTTDNWRSVQRVTVSAAEDDDALGDSATVLLTAAGGDYAGETGTVSVTIDDLDVAALELSVSKLTITEGGSATFTVSLKTQPSAGVEVELARSGSSDVSVSPGALDFTTTNWSAPQTVTVTAAEDTDAISESATISLSATGGSYGSASGSIDVEVTDNETVGLVVSKTSADIDEGSSSGADNTFTVALKTQPSANVTVTLAQPSNTDVKVDVDAVMSGQQNTLTFTASDWNRAREVVIHAGQDDDAVDDEATISISAAGGDYAGQGARVEVDVDDDDEIGILALPSPVRVVEGGSSARLRVALVTQPSAPVTLTLSQTGSINNDVEFDTDSTQTGSQSTLSFTAENWSQQQAVDISAKEDTDSTDDTASILLSAQGGDYVGLTHTVRINVTDNDAPNLVVSESRLTVREGETTSFTVQLSTRPSASVTVGLTAPAGGEVTLDGDPVQSGVQGAVVFTDQNWNQVRVVTVATLHDDDAINDIHTLGLSVSSGPAEYSGKKAGVELTVEDDDTAGISVTPASLEINEGSSKDFEVVLTSQPSSDVTVTIAQAVNAYIKFDTDANSTGDQSELRFNAQNWDDAQTVTVTALQDTDSQEEEETLRLSSSGAGYNGQEASVKVTVKDDDQPALMLTRNSLEIDGPVALDEGAGVLIEVRLVSRPSEAVKVSLSSTDIGAVTVSPATLDFTQSNWGVVQTFTVTGAEDADSVDEQAQINLTASGGNYDDRSASLQVTVDDNESAGMNVSETVLTVEEGGTKTFTVTLNNQPAGDVTVDLTISNAAVTVSPEQISFTEANWARIVDVTVSGVQDEDRQDGEDKILLTASGGGYDGVTETVTVTVQDDDIAALELSHREINVPEGGSASFLVRLSVQPTESVVVAVAGIDASSVLSIPDRLGFPRENWTQPQVITVIGQQDDDTDDDPSVLNLAASGGDYEGIRAQVKVTVVDDDEAVSEAEVEAAEGVLEEFGRTLLGSSVDVIVRRFDSLPGGSAAADVGGAEVEVGDEDAFERALRGAVRHFGGAAGVDADAGVGADHAAAADHLMRLGSIRLRDGRPLRLEQNASGRRDPLLREFTYPLGGPGGETTAWMRFNQGEFSGEFRELGQSYDGSQDGIWAGIDQRFANGVLFGAAVSESSGDAQYTVFNGGSSISMGTRLLMVMPYLEIPVRGGGVLNLILGSGGGEIDSREGDGDKSTAYLSVQMFSLGTKWPLARLGRRVALSLTGSIGSSRLGTSCSTEAPLCGLNSSGGRLSVGVELTHGEAQMGGSWKVMPRYAMSLRQDSGSQSKGGGMEFSGSARMSAPGDRFSIDVGLRWLALHATEAYEEWGGSVELQLRSRDEAGRGLSLGLGPQWGAVQSDVLQRRGALGADARELARLRGEAGRTAMRATAGYGVDLWSGLLTPFAEYSVAGGQYASSRLLGGLKYRSGETLEARLFGEWEAGQGIQPQSRIGLELSRRF